MAPCPVEALRTLALVGGHGADSAVFAMRGAGPLPAVSPREAVRARTLVVTDANPAVRARGTARN